MNAKQAKRIRRMLRQQLDRVNAGQSEHDDTRWDIRIIPTKQGTIVTTGKGTPDEKVHDDSAINVRLTPQCPRAIYKRIKRRVQANRKAG